MYLCIRIGEEFNTYTIYKFTDSIEKEKFYLDVHLKFSLLHPLKSITNEPKVVSKEFDLKDINTIFGVNYRTMTFNHRTYFYNLYSLNIKMLKNENENEDSSSENSDDENNGKNQIQMNYTFIKCDFKYTPYKTKYITCNSSGYKLPFRVCLISSPTFGPHGFRLSIFNIDECKVVYYY